jgi:hypothetical protein
MGFTIAEAITVEVEHGLIELIRSPNEQMHFNAVKYYLSTLGTGRGYVQKKQLEHLGPTFCTLTKMMRGFT